MNSQNIAETSSLRAADEPLGKDERVVTAVQHRADRVFSFRVPRPTSLHFVLVNL